MDPWQRLNDEVSHKVQEVELLRKEVERLRLERDTNAFNMRSLIDVLRIVINAWAAKTYPFDMDDAMMQAKAALATLREQAQPSYPVTFDKPEMLGS